ncbi:hypothetical protein Airi02_033510 [Actinoallomurus iriomotensis]|uniref:Uncharacterized protein n=1 Tax=Actinoallomurus iriomotensis TaxID=478107 RepID=A0A9W6S458_9ACTN|nr:hypothetical protein Airi02_033510 [Actinoallomurus iriomotensis]
MTGSALGRSRGKVAAAVLLETVCGDGRAGRGSGDGGGPDAGAYRHRALDVSR